MNVTPCITRTRRAQVLINEGPRAVAHLRSLEETDSLRRRLTVVSGVAASALVLVMLSMVAGDPDLPASPAELNQPAPHLAVAP